MLDWLVHKDGFPHAAATIPTPSTKRKLGGGGCILFNTQKKNVVWLVLQPQRNSHPILICSSRSSRSITRCSIHGSSDIKRIVVQKIVLPSFLGEVLRLEDSLSLYSSGSVSSLLIKLQTSVSSTKLLRDLPFDPESPQWLFVDFSGYKYLIHSEMSSSLSPWTLP